MWSFHHNISLQHAFEKRKVPIGFSRLLWHLSRSEIGNDDDDEIIVFV